MGPCTAQARYAFLQLTLKELGQDQPLTPRQTEAFFLRFFDDTDLDALLLTGGIRSGKSDYTAKEAFSWHPWAANDLIWLLGPDYEQTRQEMRYIFRLLDAVGLVGDASMPNAPGPWVIKSKLGCEFATKSVTNPEAIAGRAPGLVAMVEAGQQPFEAYQRAIERLAETGGKLLMTGTLESSQPWYAEYYAKWQSRNEEKGRSMNMPTSSNVFVFPGGESDPKLIRMRASLPDDIYQARFLGIPKKPAGIVHPEYQVTLHGNIAAWPVPYLDVLQQVRDGRAPLSLAIDPANHTYAAEFYARLEIEGEPYFFGLDEIHEHGKISDEIIEIAQNKSLWKYVDHLVLDIAAKQHHGNKSVSDVWRERTGLAQRKKKLGITDGITRCRSLMRVDPLTGKPRYWNHSGKQPGLVKELTEGYRWLVDSEGNPVGKTPMDKHNDACKATAYYLFDEMGHAVKRSDLGPGARFVPSWRKPHR